tara:strand:+ start:81 stop:731 length:651 start_codon:yes stop_codon:yes gene_type:complete
MIKLKTLIKEGHSTNELFTRDLYFYGDLDDFLRSVRENMKFPKMLDMVDKAPLEKLQKAMRKSVADNFIKRINKTSTEEEIVNAFITAINVTYNDDRFFNVIDVLIKYVWTQIKPALKALINSAWAVGSKKTIKDGIKDSIGELIIGDWVAINNSYTPKFRSLFEPAWRNNGEDPWGAVGKIDDLIYDAFKTQGKGPLPYNIDGMTDKIYDTIDKL